MSILVLKVMVLRNNVQSHAVNFQWKHIGTNAIVSTLVYLKLVLACRAHQYILLCVLVSVVLEDRSSDSPCGMRHKERFEFLPQRQEAQEPYKISHPKFFLA